MSTRCEKYDCTKCGACCWCFRNQAYFCDLTRKELKRLSPQFKAKNVHEFSMLDQIAFNTPTAALKTKWTEMKSGPLKGFDLCVCCQLKGNILKSAHCKIYEARPSACRKAVKPGDKTCRQIRTMIKDLLVEG